MKAYKIFNRNEDGKLTPYYMSHCGFIYGEVNKRRDGYGPFCCYRTLRDTVYESPWLVKSNQYPNTVCFEVEVTPSKDEHIWSPANKLPMPGGKLERTTFLVDDFKIVKEINLREAWPHDFPAERLGKGWEKIGDDLELLDGNI